MKRSKYVLLSIVIITLLALAMPVTAITNGDLDGDDHPHVVLLVIDIDGQPAFRCGATLLSPTVVLTAGHCTGEPGEFSGSSAKVTL